MDKNHKEIPRKRQCELLSVPRSSSYYTPQKRGEEKREEELKKALDELYQMDPCLGVRKLPVMLKNQYGIIAGRKQVSRVRKHMNLKTIYRHPRTSAPGKRKCGKYPYIIKDLKEIKVDQVWTSDITYLQMNRKNYYKCVVMDWQSREVLGWSFGPKMDIALCLEALDKALDTGRKPEIFNTDQGSQYTSTEWQQRLNSLDIKISQDGKGRWADNIHMERYWRTFKHDCFLLNEPENEHAARRLIAKWITYYNQQRVHASLGYIAPSEYSKEQGYPPAANFFSDFCAPAKRAPLRVAPSLRSGCFAYAPKSLKKCN